MKCVALQAAGCFAWLSEQALKFWQHEASMTCCSCRSVCCSEEAESKRLVALAEVLLRVAEWIQRSQSMP